MSGVNALWYALRPNLLWTMGGAVVLGLLAANLLVWGGGDSAESVRQQAQPGEVDALGQGVTARVLSAERSGGELVVIVGIEGGDDLGPYAAYEGLALITDADGATHPESGGSLGGRRITIRFSSAAAVARGPLTLRLPAVGLSESSPEPRQPNTIVGTAILAITIPNGGQVTRVPVGAEAQLGTGRIVVKELVLDSESLVALGTLEGFTREQVQSLDLRQSWVILSDGRELSLKGGQHGSGPEDKNFELRFSAPPESTAPVQLRVRLSVAVPRAFDGADPEYLEAIAALERLSGATAVVNLLP
jgi:hypothetical protein